MTQHYYPPIDLVTIRMLPLMLQQMEQHGHEAYLEGSPYPQDTREILGQLLGQDGERGDRDEVDGSVAEVNVDEALRLLEGENIERELAVLYSRMKAFGRTLENPEEGAPKAKASDKSSYFRTTVSLMTKIVELREKAANVSQWLAFKNRVMALLNNVMTVDQRNAFLKALEEDFGSPADPMDVENPDLAVKTLENTPE